MYLNYPKLTEESPEALARFERQHRSGPVGDRLKMLRLLKVGTYRSRHSMALTRAVSPLQSDSRRANTAAGTPGVRRQLR